MTTFDELVAEGAAVPTEGWDFSGFAGGATERVESSDVGAVVHFLREVVWTVPGSTVERYRPPLAELHRRIARDGVFVSW